MSETTSLQVQEHQSLKSYNTLGVDVEATEFISVESEEQLVQVLQESSLQDSRIFVLGGGSNVLFVKDFDGLVIHVAIKGIEKVKENEEYVWVRSGAGEIWHQLVLHSVEKGWGGIENLSLIPGTVGAAPIQNIGAYGVELQEVFESLEAVDITTGKTKIFGHDECRFDYRNSIFKNELKGKYVITTVTLRLDKNPKLNTTYGALQAKLNEKGIANPTIKDISDVVIEIRQSKLPDPQNLGNAGSFFKNPIVSKQKFDELKKTYSNVPGYPMEDGSVKVPAGWLIEQAGWKGKTLGNVGTYSNQALVIVNHGGATGREILQLAEKVKASVHEIFGIDLDPEVNIIS